MISYYIHYDPIGSPDSLETKGTITFSNEMIGVAMMAPAIQASGDAINVDGLKTKYPETRDGDDDGYQIDLDFGNDKVTIGPNRHEITLDLVTNQSSDSMRVLTTPK